MGPVSSPIPPSTSATSRPWIKTPLIESSVLSRAAGCRIFLKLDNLQLASSFKSRGIGNSVLHHVNAARQSPDFSPNDLHFFCSSGGNAGLASVTAAKTLGVKCTVVVPLSTEESMIIKLKAAGATAVISHGAMWSAADQYLRETVITAAEKRGEKCIYLPPFDHPLVWDGNASIIDEIHSQMSADEPDSKPDVIVCSIGGGGLFCGITQGLDRVGWGESVQVIACETRGADSLSQSLSAGHLVTLPAITSIATSLGASRVAQQTLNEAQRPHVRSFVLNDADACEACWRFAEDERMLVEPACGASVALAYHGRLKKLFSSSSFSLETKVIIVVCGGSRVGLEEMLAWKQKYGPLIEHDEADVEGGSVPSSTIA